jgi:hypothetical protein
MGGIKFQHNNLLILVDYLRSQVEQMRTVVKEARDKLEKAKLYEKYHLTNTHTIYQGRANEEPFWNYRIELQRWRSNMEIVRQCLLHMRTSLVVMINTSLSTGKSPGEGRMPPTPANFRSDMASSRGAFRLGQPTPALTHQPQFPQQPILQMVNRIPTPQSKSSPPQEPTTFYDTPQQHQTYPSQYTLTPNRRAPQVYHSTPQNRDPQFYPSTPRQSIIQSRPQIEVVQHQPQNFISLPRVVTSYSPAHQNSVRSAVVSSRNGPVPTGPSSMSSPYSRGPSSRGGQAGNGTGTTELNVRPMRGRNDFVGSLPAHGGRRRG